MHCVGCPICIGWCRPLPGSSVNLKGVAAAGTADLDTVLSTIVQAYDANTGQIVPLGDPLPSGRVPFEIQIPAFLVVDSVVASQKIVTQLQTAAWYDTVYVRNTGQADLRLDPPTATDLTFLRGAVPQTDYAVTEPPQFESGDKNWVITGGTSEQLVYTIDATGRDLGPVTVRADLDATDINDENDLTGSNSTSVTVIEPSGLFISTTISQAVNKSGDISYVNISDTFLVDVEVRNTGEAVKGVELALNSDWSPAPSIRAVGDSTGSIGATDSTRTYRFWVRAQPSSVSFQTLRASIVSAKSVNTNQPVDPSPPVDDDEFLVVQTPALITLQSFAIVPPATTTLSTLQDFDVAVRVANIGQAGVETGGQLTLTLPIGFTYRQGDQQNKPLVLDTDIVWHLTAPADRRDLDTLICVIDSTANDKNTNEQAATDVNTRNINVTVLEGGALPIDTLFISGPPGAVDDTVSTEQTFSVEFRVTPTEATVDISATINVPMGFQTVGPSTITLDDGTGTQQTGTFQVQAPVDSTLDPPLGITVLVSGTDQNTNDPVSGTSLPLPVKAVDKANLSISTGITGPPEARDSTVTIGSTFTLAATVSNAGTAEILASSNPTLRLYPPSGYTVSGGDIQPFTIGETVTWNVTAPGVSSGPDAFVLRIENIPHDENTNATATVTTRQQSIPIVTEGASVAMSDVSAAAGIDNKVVPGGTREVDKFAFSLEYRANDPNATVAVVNGVTVTILDKNGSLLSDNALRSTLSSLYVRINGDRRDVNSPQVNQIQVDLSGTDAAVIKPDSTVTLLVGVALKSNPAAQEIRLAFVGEQSVDVVDSLSTQSLRIVDAETGRPITDQFQSAPLVILSSNFQEYAHNYPNPFRAGDPSQPTNITYFLNQPGNVEIKVYALTGDLVFKKTFAAGQQHATAGPQEVQWDGRNEKGEVVRNGVYVCVITAGSNSAKFRIAVAK